MAKGFRPEFYNEDARLHTIEILAWAAKRDVFTLREARQDFNSDLMEYKDPDHEISERIRKLIKSEMVVVVTTGLLKNLVSTDMMKGKLAAAIEQRLSEIQAAKVPGRPPRIYMATQAGQKYVETRKEDLERIAKEKRRR